MKVKNLVSVLIQVVVCLDLFCIQPIIVSYEEVANTSASDTYEEDFIALVEMVYGEGLLAQGGGDAINEMLHGINLDGLKLLDIGSGLGMDDIYLAKHNNVEVVGVDPQELLVQKANLNLEKFKNDLVGTVEFVLMENPDKLNEFLDNSFDVIFSKETILHVPYEVKESYFKEIYRVLKPDGKIVIMDWMRSGPTYSVNTLEMMKIDGIVFQLSTPSEYENLLEKAGFKNIELVDTTFQHVQISQENVSTIISIEVEIKSRFGEEAYENAIKSWTYQTEAFKTRDLLTGIFRAYK